MTGLFQVQTAVRRRQVDKNTRPAALRVGTVPSLFGPSGADQRKAQDGCQNGQLWLPAFIRTAPTESQPGDKWKQRSPDTKYTRPTALCVGADPDRAARCEILP